MKLKPTAQVKKNSEQNKQIYGSIGKKTEKKK